LAEYQKQAWYSAKPLALWAALFLYLNWALYLGLNRSVSTYEKGVFYGGLSLVTLPVPFMIVKNWPRTCVPPRARSLGGGDRLTSCADVPSSSRSGSRPRCGIAASPSSSRSSNATSSGSPCMRATPSLTAR
jgi:hypothetical protein